MEIAVMVFKALILTSPVTSIPCCMTRILGGCGSLCSFDMCFRNPGGSVNSDDDIEKKRTWFTFNTAVKIESCEILLQSHENVLKICQR